MADSDVAPFIANKDNPLVVATHHKPIGLARNSLTCDPSTVISHTGVPTMVPMEEIRIAILETASHYASFKIAGDGTDREVWLHDLAEVVSRVAVASEVCHGSCCPASSLELSGDAALGHATLPDAHRALPKRICILALEPSHHGRLGGWMYLESLLELPIQVLHAGPHLVFREGPPPRNDLHDTEVRDFTEEALIDLQIEVGSVLESTVADSDVAPFVANEDNPPVAATHHKPIGVARDQSIGFQAQRGTVISHTGVPTMVPMEEIGIVVLENSPHDASFHVASDGTDRKDWLHDPAEVISRAVEAAEVCYGSRGPAAGLDPSGDAALGHTTLPGAHCTLPNRIGILALEPCHHGPLVNWFAGNGSLELPIQVLHACPHLVFREGPVPRDDFHDTEIRDFIGEVLIDVQIEVGSVLESTVADSDVAPFVANEDNPLLLPHITSQSVLLGTS